MKANHSWQTSSQGRSVLKSLLVTQSLLSTYVQQILQFSSIFHSGTFYPNLILIYDQYSQTLSSFEQLSTTLEQL